MCSYSIRMDAGGSPAAERHPVEKASQDRTPDD
jgi:hypothetical protein